MSILFRIFYLQDRFCEITTGARTLGPTLEEVERTLEKFTILLIAIAQPLLSQPLNSELFSNQHNLVLSVVQQYFVHCRKA